jgi:MFS family permease
MTRLNSGITEPTNRWGLATVVVGLTMLASCTSMFPVLGPRITELYSITAEQYGEIIGLRSLCRIPSLLVVGPLIALLGARRVAELAMIGIGAAYLILGIGQTLLSLRLCMMIMGLFFGLFSIAIPALLISLFPSRKRGMFSVNLVALAFPSMIYPFVAGHLLKWTADKPELQSVIFAPFGVIGGLLAGGAVLLFLWKREPGVDPSDTDVTSNRGESADSGFLAAIKNRMWEIAVQLCSFRSGLIVLLICLHGSADNTTYTFLPMFMEARFEHQAAGWTAWAVSAHGLAYVLTRSVLSVMPEQVGQRAILTLAGPLGGSLVIAMLWYSPPLAIPLLYLLASLMFAAEFPTLASEVSTRSMGGFGTVLATGLLLSEVATFAMQKTTGRLADSTGDYRVALSFAACGFIAFGVIAFVTGIGRRDAAPA